MKITATHFRIATGHKPKNDDLERCNCPDQGKVGHWHCGWNWKENLPCFMAGPETKTEEGV